MWSGPRTISTAMMRSFGARADTLVVDEPLYAHYLAATGLDHPGRDAVIRSQPTSWREVADALTGPLPVGVGVHYQKHMTHHLLPDIDRGWLRKLTNCFLIREPREVITSLIKHVPDATLADTGFPQQAEIFERVMEWTGKVPPVVDARDVLDHPREVLGKLCGAVGVEFTDRMLSWPPGPRDTDGVWAKDWYKEVETTTSFRPYKPKDEPVPERMLGTLEKCDEFYSSLFVHRLRADARS
jgi:hypothetical protein